MSEGWKWDKVTQRKYDKSIQVATFLGGFILATLTALIAQSDNNPILCTMAVENRTDFCKFVVGDGKQLSNPSFWPEYKELLIGGMGLVGTLFIVSVYGMKVGFVHEKRIFFLRFPIYFMKLVLQEY